MSVAAALSRLKLIVTRHLANRPEQAVTLRDDDYIAALHLVAEDKGHLHAPAQGVGFAIVSTCCAEGVDNRFAIPEARVRPVDVFEPQQCVAAVDCFFEQI